MRSNGRRSWTSCTRIASSIRHRLRCMPPCWMKEPTIVRFGPCIAFWTRRARFGSAATRPGIPSTRHRSSWPPLPIRSGRGISRSCSGPVKWTYFYLYVILDIFSRYVVGWMIAHHESSALAKRLIAETCEKQNVQPGQLTIHADRGSSMKSKPVALLLADLGVTKTHSRPYVSDDNPYSESQFKTLKYRPGFPDRFGSIQDARSFCREFFPWYNREHRHSGIGLMTPEMVHYGKAEQVSSQRQICSGFGI